MPVGNGESSVQARRCPATVMRSRGLGASPAKPGCPLLRLGSRDTLDPADPICEVQMTYCLRLIQLVARLGARLVRWIVVLPMRSLLGMAVLSLGGLVAIASPAAAHHAMDGQLPSTVFEGLMAGLAHPIIGLDHFAFMVTIGLLGLVYRSLWIPLSVLGAAMVGTAVHLLGWSPLWPELWVALSVLAGGSLLVMRQRLPWGAIAALGGLAGLFHGYAYGEAIFGAAQPPLLSYLVGFTLIQAVVMAIAYGIGNTLLGHQADSGLDRSVPLRLAGAAIAGIGFTFFANTLLGLVFPVG